MNCKNCHQANCIKKGKRNGRQRFFCKNCSSSFQELYCYKAYHPTTNPLIIKLLKEGCGVLSISRIIGISKNTVLSRMLKLSKQIAVPNLSKLGCKYELDEMWTFIKKKEDFTWITYAIERESKNVVGFLIGGKSITNIRPLVDNILLLSPERVYTDKLNIYPSLIPKETHKVFKYCTNKIERNNLTIRTHVKRLARRTICFSKKEKYLEAHLKIYFWG